ncbi:MAG: hypothetical protein ACKPKO_02575, partial [Candidatus Fonsibacter sp.]
MAVVLRQVAPSAHVPRDLRINNQKFSDDRLDGCHPFGHLEDLSVRLEELANRLATPHLQPHITEAVAPPWG